MDCHLIRFCIGTDCDLPINLVLYLTLVISVGYMQLYNGQHQV